jgi:hypothetical protein
VIAQKSTDVARRPFKCFESSELLPAGGEAASTSATSFVLPVSARQPRASNAVSLSCHGEYDNGCLEIRNRIRMEFFPQKDCAELSDAQSTLLLSRQQVRLILKFPYFDPFRFSNFRCSWQANTGDDHFVVNFGRDVKAREKPIEEVKAAKLCQNNKRR